MTKKEMVNQMIGMAAECQKQAEETQSKIAENVNSGHPMDETLTYQMLVSEAQASVFKYCAELVERE